MNTRIEIVGEKIRKSVFNELKLYDFAYTF